MARLDKSTTVRSSHGAPRALRAGLGALDALAPALAARIAERLFMAPPRHAAPAWERAALAGGEPFAIAAAGTTLRGVRLGEGPAVLLVHGWGGRGSQLGAFVPALLEAGCAVVAFDGPAHGASNGRTSNMVRLADAVAAMGHHFGARAAIGHSLGGAALAVALHRGLAPAAKVNGAAPPPGLALDAAVLVAPPSTPEAFLEPFCAALGLGEDARDRLRLRIERNVGVSMAELRVPRLAAALPTPAVVIHDAADAEVRFEEGAAIAAAWPGARLLRTEGLGHRRILRDATVVREAAAFVVGRLPRCGCGRLAVADAEGAPRCETCLLAVYLARREGRAARPAA